MAEELVDAIHASGGRVLTRAKAVSVIVRDGRAAGVTVSREGGGGGAAAAAETVDALVVGGDGLGSVISSIGVLDSFRGLVPPNPDVPDVDLVTAGAWGAVTGAEGKAEDGTAKALGEKESKGYDPAGFRILRAARPRVHLCVGLQGNWLEDLDGTSSYVHHVSFMHRCCVGEALVWFGLVMFGLGFSSWVVSFCRCRPCRCRNLQEHPTSPGWDVIFSRSWSYHPRVFCHVTSFANQRVHLAKQQNSNEGRDQTVVPSIHSSISNPARRSCLPSTGRPINLNRKDHTASCSQVTLWTSESNHQPPNIRCQYFTANETLFYQ